MKVSSAAIGTLALSALLVSGCTRVETGEAGLRKTFNGTVEVNELGTGFHQTLIGDVLIFSTKEILIPVENLRPQTLDKITMKDFDVNFLYSVQTNSIGELYNQYSLSAHSKNERGEIYVIANVVKAFVESAISMTVAKYNALDVNGNFDSIQANIQRLVDEKLTAEGLNGRVKISQIVIKNSQIPDALAESANNQARAENERQAKITEVKTAKLEAERMEFLVKQADPRYIALLNAQAQLEMAKKATGTVWVVPQGSTVMLQPKQ